MAAKAPDMDYVRPGLYLGSQAAENSPLEDLTAQGITSVLQLGTGFLMQPTHPSLQYKCIAVADFAHAELIKMLIQEKAFQFIEEGIQKGGILVHCQAGMSRSVSAVVAHLMIKEKLLFEDALVEVIKCRRIAAPNRGFCNQLKSLEDCRGNLKKYKGEKKWLNNLFDWMTMLEKARKSAGAKSCLPSKGFEPLLNALKELD